MEHKDERSAHRRSPLRYGVWVAVLVVVLGFGIYSWQVGWIGSHVQRPEVGQPAGGEKHPQVGGEVQEEGRPPRGVPGGITLSPEEKANIGLRTEEASVRMTEDVRKINGIIKPHPDKVALVASRIPGRAVSVHANVGDPVRKGQDLADIQSVELEKAELDLIQAENKLVLVKAELERIRNLVEKGIAARRELLSAESQHNATLNEIESLTRQLELLGMSTEEIKRIRREKIVSTLHLKAPFGGTVVERTITLGQTVEPNTHLFKILDTSTMIAEGEAFEDLLPLLRVGQKVRVTVTPYPDKFFEGRIIFISPTVEPEKRTIHFWVEVQNQHGMLKEGFFARLFVAVREGSRVLTIPAEALMSDHGKDFVFVEKDGNYVRADVVLGTRTDRYVEVKQGLNPGDRVVTEGKMQLYAKYLSVKGGEPTLGDHAH